jgi:hypothetical protein
MDFSGNHERASWRANAHSIAIREQKKRVILGELT